MKTGEIENCKGFEVGSGADIVSPSSLALSTEVYRKSNVHVEEYRSRALPKEPRPPSRLVSYLLW